ncbi:MAG: PHP domain-containing protein [Spirochaetes bacterium]|nr:PHP domain-containing protein [Spirochaetota bacterium]
MKILDLHIHTSFSFDSSVDMEQYLDLCKKIPSSVIGFCEHYEINFDFERYIEKLNYLKFKYKLFADIKKGIEASIKKRNILYDKKIYNELDYIIWSNHNFEKDIKKYYLELNDFIISNMNIDVIGHIDFPFRFIDNINELSNFNDIEKTILKMLENVIKKDIVLEFNYYNFNSNYKNFKKIFEILWNNYFLLGGKKITLGSDSHDLNNFLEYLKNFNLYYNFIKDKTLIFFNNHKQEEFIL